MTSITIQFNGHTLLASGSGVLWWPETQTLCVSDLHLGKAERMSRRTLVPIPRYEADETLRRLEAEIAALNPRRVICLGDSFDDRESALALPEDAHRRIALLQENRDWVWVEGNHDRGSLPFRGRFCTVHTQSGLTFRHIADPAQSAEVSGHYHPKARVETRGRRITRSAFLVDSQRLIMPAFGTFTGGLLTSDKAICALMQDDATAILTGDRLHQIPMPR